MPRRGSPGVADAELVVDLPAIADRAAPVEHKGLGRARGAEFVGNLIGGILQNRKCDLD